MTAPVPLPRQSTGGAHGAAKRQFVAVDMTPRGVIHWSAGDLQQRNAAIANWRRALMAEITKAPRPLKVAWLIASMVEQRGYCFARDARIADETSVSPRKVRQAITDLEELGAIVVRWVDRTKGKGQERRIWLASAILGTGAATGGWIGAPTSKGRPDAGPTFGGSPEASSRPEAGPKGRPEAGPTEQEEQEGAPRSGRVARLKAWQAGQRSGAK